MKRILYKEEQKFRQPWIWLIIAPATGGSLIYFTLGLHKQLVLGEPFGNKPMSDAGLIVTGIFILLLTLGLTWLFFSMKLIVEIRGDGIYYRFPPLINAFRKIGREEIESLEVRTYKPLKEYGGWGIRTGSKQYGRAYNVRGNTGLQLHLKNGQKILFGTQRNAAIRDAAIKMLHSGEKK